MNLTLSEIFPHLLYHFKSDQDLIKAIEEISLKFTADRKNISDYLNDERLVSAYTAFYLLTNIPKLQEVMKWLPAPWIEELKQSDFIDLGSGPGTFSFAWKEMGAGGDFYQIELSRLMKDQARKLWEQRYGSSLHQASSWQWKSQKRKFLLFGHSANEMGVDKALDYIISINPEHILFIEPGTKEFFPKMLYLRNALLEEGYNVLYPCPKPEQCPMKGTEEWCHQFIQVKQDPEVERISQMARKDRKLLPLTVQAFSKTYKGENPKERLVRVLPETKFSHEWEVCHNNNLEHYQVMKRDLSKSDSKEIGSIMSGASLESEIIKELPDAKRVKLLSRRSH